MRLDKSVSGEVQKLRGRLGPAKAELPTTRADVVTVTSPARPPPPPAGVRLGTKHQMTKAEVTQTDSRTGSQKAGVGKPTPRPGTTVTQPLRSTQQKKLSITYRPSQQLPQKHVPPVQTASKPPATRRPVETLEPKKMPRNTNKGAAPVKPEVKKRQTAVSHRPKHGSRPPADTNKQHTTKKLTKQRESDFTNVDRVGKEAAKHVSEHAIDDQIVSSWFDYPISADELRQLTTYETTDHQQSTWFEFPIDADELTHLKNDAIFGEFWHLSETSPNALESTVPPQTEHATDDHMVSISAAERLMQSSDDFERESDKTEVDEDRENAEEETGFKAQDVTELDSEKTGYKAQDLTELESDGDGASSVSVYADQHYDNDDLDDVRMLNRLVTSSTELPLSTLSDKDPELAALSTTSSVSHRNLTSPALSRRSASGDVEVTQAVDVQETDRSEYSEEDDPDVELAKVIKKEDENEIIVDVGHKERRRESRQQAVQDDDVDARSLHERSNSPASSRSSMSSDDVSLKVDDADTDHVRNDDDAKTYSSSSDYEDEEESYKRDYFEEDTDEVDPVMKTNGILSENEDEDIATETHVPVNASLPHGNEELEHEAPETKRTYFAEAAGPGEMDERLHGDVTSCTFVKEVVSEYDYGSTADEPITKETAERVPSNAVLMKDTALEQDNDFDDFFLPAVSGPSEYLEREYGLPSLTALGTEAEQDAALGDEDLPLYHDEDATRLYHVGEDGLPDFGVGHYSLGVATEEGEKAAMAEARRQLLSESEENAMSEPSAVRKSERMDDDVSILPEAALSEAWNEAMSSSVAGLVEPQTRAEAAEMMSATMKSLQSMLENAAIKTEVRLAEVVDQALPASANLHAAAPNVDHLLDTV